MSVCSLIEHYYFTIIIIIIIKKESAVQGWERVRTFYQSEYPTPHNQHMEGRKREYGMRQIERAD